MPPANNALFLLGFFKTEPLVLAKETGGQNWVNSGKIEHNWFAFKRLKFL